MSGRADIVPTILKSKQTIQGNDDTKLGNRFDNDPWDAPSISDALNSTSKHATSTIKSNASYARTAANPKTKPVPDDWDDEDDEDEEEADSTTLWREANTKDPMPEVVLSNTSSVPNPPQEILSAPLRILKRPSSSTPTDGSTSANGPNNLISSTDRLREREAAYQAARARIFGESSSTEDSASEPSHTNSPISGPNKIIFRPQSSRQSSSSSSTPPSTGPGASSVLRNPHGPISNEDPNSDNTVAKGFRNGTGHIGGAKRGGGKQGGNRETEQYSSGAKGADSNSPASIT